MKTSEVRRYCLQCQYDLTGLEEHRCPECGKEFDPEDARTWQNFPTGKHAEASRHDLKLTVGLAALCLGGLFVSHQADDLAIKGILLPLIMGGAYMSLTLLARGHNSLVRLAGILMGLIFLAYLLALISDKTTSWLFVLF